MTSNEIIIWLARELTLARNIDRQEDAKKLIDYYSGVQLDYLESLLNDQFDKPEQMKLQLRVENVIEEIGDAISRVFDQAPVLASEDEKIQEFLTGIDPLLPLIWKKAEVYKNLTRVCAIHSWWDDEKMAIRHTILPSHVLFVEQDERDAGRAITVVYTRTILDTVGAPKIEYIHWDSDTSFIWDRDDPNPRPFDAESNPGMVNPYKIIPICFIRDDVAEGNFFEDIDETLLNAQEAVNVELTTKAFNLKMQGFSQPVLVGWDGKSPINVDPSRPILIPAAMSGETQGDFRFVSPDAKLGEIQESVDGTKTRLKDRFGISSDTVRSASSGYALKLMDGKLNRRREDDIPLSLQFVHDVIEVDRVIWNTHNPGKQISPGVTAQDFAKLYTVDFPEPNYDDDPEKVQRMDKEDIALGVSTPAERLSKLNPDITPEEADKRIAANMKKNASWLGERKKFGLADLIGGKTQPGNPNAS